MTENDTPDTPPKEGMPPSPPPPPPPPARTSPAGKPTVKIGEWFTAAWEIIKPVWLEYVIAVLVFEIVLAIGYFLCLLPGVLLIGPMTGGVFVYAAKRMLGLEAEIGDVFKGFRRFVDLMLVGLALLLIPAIVAAILWAPAILAAMGAGATSGATQETIGGIGGMFGCVGCVIVPIFMIVYPIIVGTLFIFAIPLVLFRNMQAIDALKASFAIVKPNFVNFLLLWLSSFVILFVSGALGGLLLFVGSLILTPLAWGIVVTMQLMAYRDFVGLTKEDLSLYA